MLKLWFFILLIDGQNPSAHASDSEEHCQRGMAKLIALQRAIGNNATGACYVRVSEIDSTERIPQGVLENR